MPYPSSNPTDASGWTPFVSSFYYSGLCAANSAFGIANENMSSSTSGYCGQLNGTSQYISSSGGYINFPMTGQYLVEVSGATFSNTTTTITVLVFSYSGITPTYLTPSVIGNLLSVNYVPASTLVTLSGSAVLNVTSATGSILINVKSNAAGTISFEPVIKVTRLT